MTARSSSSPGTWPARHPALSVERNAAAGYDHMQMRMVSERRTPGVQYRGDADPGTKMFGIGGDRQCGRLREGRGHVR
jgi:hypothetical protein